jgi:NitT/TauT family transport system ATP-binding protein
VNTQSTDKSLRTPSFRASVELENVSVTFHTDRGITEAVRDVSFSVREKEFVTLIGPSGCGKTTILRLIADIIAPTSGEVRVLGGGPAEARRNRQLGYVFQSPALLAWRTVLNNVLLPSEVMRDQHTGRAQELLKLVGLEGFENHYPDELSGGMQQRVSIARALSFDPSILLMDEPFGALDLITRERMSQELLHIWENTHKTVLFVTHSIQEAVALSDRVLVLSPRPAVVQAEEVIELSRPRSRDNRVFQRIASKLREMLV